MKHIINPQWLALSRRYQAALHAHLRQGPKARVQPAHRLGEQAVKLGLETLDMALIHKTAFAALVVPANSAAAKNRVARRAGIFFNEVITPIEKTHRAGIESAARLNRKNKALAQRTAQLAAANRHLKQGILQRKIAEEALKKSDRHHAKLLRESNQLRKHLQHLVHQILSAQENERKKISQDLQDEIAQTLLGINVRLLTLKKSAAVRPKGLVKGIASTRRLVEKFVRSMNRVADEFGVQYEA